MKGPCSAIAPRPGTVQTAPVWLHHPPTPTRNPPCRARRFAWAWRRVRAGLRPAGSRCRLPKASSASASEASYSSTNRVTGSGSPPQLAGRASPASSSRTRTTSSPDGDRNRASQVDSDSGAVPSHSMARDACSPRRRRSRISAACVGRSYSQRPRNKSSSPISSACRAATKSSACSGRRRPYIKPSGNHSAQAAKRWPPRWLVCHVSTPRA